MTCVAGVLLAYLAAPLHARERTIVALLTREDARQQLERGAIVPPSFMHALRSRLDNVPARSSSAWQAFESGSCNSDRSSTGRRGRIRSCTSAAAPGGQCSWMQAV